MGIVGGRISGGYAVIIIAIVYVFAAIIAVVAIVGVVAAIVGLVETYARIFSWGWAASCRRATRRRTAGGLCEIGHVDPKHAVKGWLPERCFTTTFPSFTLICEVVFIKNFGIPLASGFEFCAVPAGKQESTRGKQQEPEDYFFWYCL